MKKTLFFAIIAITVNAFAQINQLNAGIKQQIVFAPKNIDFNINRYGLVSSRIYSNLSAKIDSKYDDFVQQSIKEKYDSIYTYVWDSLINRWKIDTREMNICYDANNNWIGGFIEKWDGSVWVNSIQYLSTYNTYNNLTNDLTLKWNGSIWINYQQFKYAYDVNNNLINRLYQDWNGSVWVNSRQHIYTFDTNNHNIIELVKDWKESGWYNSYQRLYTYDFNGNMTIQLTQYWNLIAWVNSNNLILTYDDWNNNTGYLVQNWDKGTWVNIGQSINTYDANNKIISRLYQKLNGGIWMNDYQRSYTYDANNFMTSYTYKKWNDESTKIISGDSIYYYFHIMNTDTNDSNIPKKNISVCPNPSSGKLTVRGNHAISSIEIYDLLGKRVYFDNKLNEQVSIVVDLSAFKKGIYLIKTQIEQKTSFIKIVVQ